MRSAGADDAVQRIRDRISLHDLVSRYVSLKRQGRRHVGLCPFHAENTPSFTVDDDRGLFHCFGCKEGGDIFSFLMKIERIGFPEALAELARMAGVELPKGRGPRREERERLVAANEAAARFFRAVLGGRQGETARAYLERRAVPAAVVDRYGLGYAPGGEALRAHLGHSPALIDAALRLGLLGRAADGRLYDRFRRRVMFPIRDRAGHVIAFGGRVLGEETPKYLNSPESPIFHKGRTLYGLPEARDAILADDRVVLVEGYMDVLLLVAAGIGNVVATLGTAISSDQLRILGRFTRNVVAFFDGDEAGRAAAERAFAACGEAGVWAKAAFLPEGDDPDSFVRRRGVDAVRALLDSAGSLADFFLERVSSRTDASVPGKARAAAEVAGVARRIGDPLERDLFLRQASERLGIGEDILRRAVGGGPPAVQGPASAGTDPAARWPAAERLLVEAMAVDREVAEWVHGTGAVRWFETPELADAARALGDAARSGLGATATLHLLPEPLQRRVSAILLDTDAVLSADRMQMARDCVARLEERARRKLLRSAKQELGRAEARGDEQQSRAIRSRITELLRGGGSDR